MNKTILLMLIGLLLISSLAIAKETIWYDIKVPSTTLAPTEKTKLIETNNYVWNTNNYWKDNNCYYFDLQIGYETTMYDDNLKRNVPFTNYTWSDANREITCTNKVLTATEIETLQLSNIEWTLKELGKTNAPIVELVKTQAQKGENLKDNTVKSNNVDISITVR